MMEIIKKFYHFTTKIMMEVRKLSPFFLRTYKYNVELTNTNNIIKKFKLLLECIWKTYIDRKRILFYPEGPVEFHALFKILLFLGYKFTSNPQKSCDIAIKWWLAFDGNPFAPVKVMPLIKGNKNRRVTVLNSHCNDISKHMVNSTFEEVFGYRISVDPCKHNGKCVMKLNWNALHKGRIIECPIKSIDDDFVYQKLIRNETRDGFVEDMRVPVFGNKTPFVYLKYRSIKDRFVDRVHTNTRATIAEVDDVLSKEEIDNIHRFCARIGMDYGEVDVLRDKGDGRIFIVDANNTPSGPPSPISDSEGKIAVLRLSKAFEETFGI
jgi:hypothetical protein